MSNTTAYITLSYEPHNPDSWFKMAVDTPEQVQEAKQVMWETCTEQATVYYNGIPVGAIYCPQEY